jgi:hypothetical protein
MIDAQGREMLLRLIRREGQSLLRYVGESFPWITPEEQQTLANLQTIIKEEQAETVSLAHMLARHHIVPGPPAPYPMSYTCINYVTLDHLIPLLIDYQCRRLAELEADREQVHDAEARRHADHFLDIKRRHLATLERMLAEIKKKEPAGIPA